MKKIIASIIALLFLTSAINCYALEEGEKVGNVLSTDIVAYINGVPVSSYNVKGQTVVIAEDIANYGFDVTWDGNLRMLNILRNCDKIIESTYDKSINNNGIGKKLYNIVYSDIDVFIGGTRIPSFCLNGRMAINIDSLSAFGQVLWNENDRSINLNLNSDNSIGKVPEMDYWVDILAFKDKPLEFKYAYYTGGISGYFTEIKDNEIGTPELTLVATNMTDTDIDSFEFECEFFDSFGNKVKKIGSNSTKFIGVVQNANLPRRFFTNKAYKGNNWNVYTFNLVLYDLAYEVDQYNIKVTKIKYKNGYVWTL